MSSAATSPTLIPQFVVIKNIQRFRDECFLLAMYSKTLRTSFSFRTFACAICFSYQNQTLDEYLVWTHWLGRTSLYGENIFLMEIMALQRNQMFSFLDLVSDCCTLMSCSILNNLLNIVSIIFILWFFLESHHKHPQICLNYFELCMNWVCCLKICAFQCQESDSITSHPYRQWTLHLVLRTRGRCSSSSRS